MFHYCFELIVGFFVSAILRFIMFRLNKNNRSPKFGERIDFQFSNLQALQVPKGWDRLFVSLVAVETGKTIAKSTKATVENGTCQWTETLSESFWISQEDSSKYLEECLFKLVLSMGSARSGILGEATVNMAHYMISRASAPVSFTLKKCNYGTILQVLIHCLPPRTRFRDEELRSSDSPVEDQQDAETRDLDTQSNGSIGSYTPSTKSPSSKDFGSPPPPLNVGNMETSYSPSPTNHSFNSANGSLERQYFSPRKSESSGKRFNTSVRRDISNSLSSSPRGADNPSISNRSSFNSTVMIGSRENTPSSPIIGKSSLSNMGSSKNLLDTAEDTIEELRDESKMWERDARKFMLELDIVSKKFADQKSKQADLEMELSAACIERESMKKEVEQLKKLLEESMLRQAAGEDFAVRSDSLILIKKELENEVKFQRDMNADLALQLQRNQESNIELVSVLQELEDTIEKQKVEIQNLSAIQSKFDDLEDSFKENLEDNRKYKECVELLEQEMEEKNNNLKNEQNLKRQSLIEMEGKYKSMLTAEEEKVFVLAEKLVQSEEVIRKNSEDSIREIKSLKEKIEELEKDCTELTDENLDILCKIKTMKSNITDSEVDELKSQIVHLEEELRKNVLKGDQTLKKLSDIIVQIETAYQQVNGADTWVNVKKIDTSDMESWVESISDYLVELNKLLEVKIAVNKDEMDEKNNAIRDAKKLIEDCILKIQELESTLASKEEENELITKCKTELEIQILNFENENNLLQERVKISEGEREVSAKLLDDLKNDLTVLSTSVDSHVLSNKVLENKLSELERGKRELELHLFQVEEENVELSELVSKLESQRESGRLEIEDLKSVVLGLEDEIGRLKLVIESQKSDLEEKLKESKYLKSDIEESQESNKNLMEERNSLISINEELNESCRKLENELRESRTNMFDYSKKVGDLDKNFSLMIEKFASKEKSLESELDALDQENRELNHMYTEKTTEVEALRERLLESENEKKRIVELESSLQEANSLANEKIGENEKIAKFLANYRSREEKLKTSVNDLELKVTVSEYERQQLIEETENLKSQQQKAAQYEEEILALSGKLKRSEFEKEEIEGLLEEVKGEKVLLVEKVSSLNKSVSELEECKKKKVLLEEKVLKMEKDLLSKEALQEGEVKNEVTRMKRANKQYQRKVQQLEDEKDEISKKVQLLEKELRLLEAAKQDRMKLAGKKSTSHNLENRRKLSVRTSHLRELGTQYQREGDSENSFNEESPKIGGADKVQMLENELAEALEANNTYKLQLQRLLSEGGNSNSGASIKKTEVIMTSPTIEEELKELQDRYFQMSLKYAEVEAEREDLVMMLKASKTGKKWF